MAIVKLAPPFEQLSGKPWKDANFAFCVNKQTGVVHTQQIYPWTHGFNDMQLTAQAKMREANRRVHEILSDPELREPYEEEWKRSAPPDERRRLRDYVFMKVYKREGFTAEREGFGRRLSLCEIPPKTLSLRRFRAQALSRTRAPTQNKTTRCVSLFVHHVSQL